MVYARFSRTRKGSGAYGRKRSYTRRRRTAGFKKVLRPRFAMSGYRRNVEKKYWDKTYQSNSSETLAGNAVGGQSTNNGVTYISNTWGSYTFGKKEAPVTTSNDIFKGLNTGTNARTRIGNKVKPVYVKGAFTFTAALTVTSETQNQNGEAWVFENAGGATTNRQYLRTTYRMMIVKDMQVNSVDTQITWAQVMDTNNLQAGVHSELNVDNMGRFIILEDKLFTVDGNNPQKTVPYSVSGAKIGSIRYNGPSETALTDKGLYVIWAAFVMGSSTTLSSAIELPSPVGHSRLCFTDE